MKEENDPRSDLVSLARKIDALGMWTRVVPCCFAFRVAESPVPYFCAVVMAGPAPGRESVRLLFLEGWQTFHTYLRLREDENFGVHTSPVELPLFEVMYPFEPNGEIIFCRHDPCYVPVPMDESFPGAKDRLPLLGKLMWQFYGLLLRFEEDPEMLVRYLRTQSAILARVEDADGNWKDAPLALVEPPPYKEVIRLDKDLVKKAKDVPFIPDDEVIVDFRPDFSTYTKENGARPRYAFRLNVIDAKTKGVLVQRLLSAQPNDGGLKAVWEDLARLTLRAFVENGRIPGVVKVASGRIFRMLRPLCMEIPLKLSLHDHLPLP